MPGNEPLFSVDHPGVHPGAIAGWAAHLGTREVDPLDVRSRLSRGTLPDAFAATAQRRRDKPALQVRDQTITHGEIDEQAGKAAGALMRMGIGPDRPVLLIAETTLAHIVAYLGTLQTGAPVVLAHPSLTTNELERLASESSAKLLIGSGEALMSASEGTFTGIDALLGLEEGDRETTDIIIRDLQESTRARPDIDPEGPAILAFTSGTTGKPKCAPLSHRNLLASIRGVMWAWRWSERDHLVHALPISHQHGLGGVHATLLAGSKASLLGQFDASTLLQSVVHVGATVLFAVPTIYERLLSEVGEQVLALRDLRLLTSGSSALPATVGHRLQAATGHLPLERYGTTESGLDVSNLYEGPRSPGTVGLPLPGVEVLIADRKGEVQKDGEPGEVLIRGPQVFSGYLDQDQSGKDPFILDWFRTGDLGLIEEETGFLRLIGRSKELIITGGMNVYPREVEDALAGLPAISDVAVIGVPSETTETSLCDRQDPKVRVGQTITTGASRACRADSRGGRVEGLMIRSTSIVEVSWIWN
jgi:malonyl-CoA/methylmalonyl-CoA synthetase